MQRLQKGPTMTREQAMREAAERGLGGWGALLGEDHVDPAQATAGADAERARIVAWLLEMSEQNTPFGLHAGDWPHAALAEASAAIERGEPWSK
jgi:hypothetical protein